MATWGEILKADADMANIPLRTLSQVKQALVQAKKGKCDARIARMMLRHGRLTKEALQYVMEYSNHIFQCEAYGITRTD